MTLRLITVLGICAAFLAPAATAQSFEEELANASELTLLPGWQSEDGRYLAAVMITLAPGWKTYWRDPGGAGIAPAFDWSGSENVAGAEYIWPAPSIFDLDGTRTIGFADRMILPVLIEPEDANAPVSLRVVADYGVCKDICVPARGDAAAEISAATQMNRTLIDTAIAAAPRSGAEAGMVQIACDMAANGDDYTLDIAIDFDQSRDADAVLIEMGSQDYWVAETVHEAQGGGLRIGADVLYFGETPHEFDPGAVRLTLLGPDGGVDIQGCG